MTNFRWFESPESIGARFVGRADELVKLGNTGWYLDGEFPEETAWGVVWQLPARKGRPVYLAGVQTSYDGRDQGAAFELPLSPVYGVKGRSETIYFTDDMTITEVAGFADDLARIFAETEREYQEKWRAANRWRDLLEDEKTQLEAIEHARRILRREKIDLAHVVREREQLEAIWGEDSLREMEV